MRDDSVTKSDEAAHSSSKSSNTHRRQFLKATAAAGGVVGISGLGATVLAQDSGTTIKLGGEVAGWQGQAPSSINGETNPTLDLTAGEKVTVTWTNLDGAPHNFQVLDSSGSTLYSTEIMSDQGASQDADFTATTEMAQYNCEVHPSSMVGDVNVSGGSTQNTTQTATETATETSTENKGPYFPKGATVSLETVADGFISPLGFETPPGDDDRKFILDQVGKVYIYESGELQNDPFIDIGDKLVDLPIGEGYSETGLLGLAFHPDFQNNGKFYLRYGSPVREGTPDDFDHTAVLSEFMANDDRSAGDPDSERTLLEVPEPQGNHNGGPVLFGPDDGYLYVAFGDGGAADDNAPGHVEDWYDGNAGGNGQDVTENLRGSILRIDVDSREGDKPYGIPDDNPLVGREGLDEHYAWGFRNPWRIGFSDGMLIAADVGQNLWEEIDVVEKGNNYGWNVKEGTHCFSTDNPNKTPSDDACPSGTPDDVRGGEPFIDPVIEYPHIYQGEPFGSSITGGFIYHGDAVPELQGKYLFGDLNKNGNGGEPAGRLFAATPSETEGEMWSGEQVVVDGTDSGLLDNFLYTYGRDKDGEMYILTNDSGTLVGETGAVHRLVAPGQSNEGTSTETTTETTQETSTETEQGGGNGKAKSGNGKAKSGNGKAKTGDGSQN